MVASSFLKSVSVALTMGTMGVQGFPKLTWANKETVCENMCSKAFYASSPYWQAEPLAMSATKACYAGCGQQTCDGSWGTSDTRAPAAPGINKAFLRSYIARSLCESTKAWVQTKHDLKLKAGALTSLVNTIRRSLIEDEHDKQRDFTDYHGFFMAFRMTFQQMKRYKMVLSLPVLKDGWSISRKQLQSALWRYIVIYLVVVVGFTSLAIYYGCNRSSGTSWIAPMCVYCVFGVIALVQCIRAGFVLCVYTFAPTT